MAEPRLDDAIPGLLDAMATLLLGTAEALDASERLLADVLQLFDVR